MTRVGNLCFLILCWPGVVPNQRQLSIVVSDWGSYLGSLFPPVVCVILFLCSACEHCIYFTFRLFGIGFGEFHLLKHVELYARCTLVHSFRRL